MSEEQAPVGREGNKDMHRTRYTARVEDGVIVVEDQDRGRSVTNDAELVVADLAKRAFDLSLPVIYRDTAGRWDGLAVRAGRFGDFYPLNAGGSTSHGEARERLQAMRAARDPRLGDAR